MNIQKQNNVDNSIYGNNNRPMSIKKGNNGNIKWIGVTSALFGVLLIANYATEILRQAVVLPGSVAESAVAADCRPDELVEEDLSLKECELMVSNIQIMLASSPSWFRPITICWYIFGLVSALSSLVFGMRFVNSPESAQSPLYVSFVLLVGIDFLIFATTSATGPLLRSIYLWPTLIWFFIHLVLLVAVVNYNSESKRAVN